MTWRTHLAGGIASLWFMAFLPHMLTPDTFGLAALSAGLGALLPDLDSHTSRLHTVEIYGIHPFVPMSQVVRATFQHRGALHSRLGVVFVAVCFALPLIIFTGWVMGIALLLGYVSHLALDCCTPRGLRLKWPAPDHAFLLPKGTRVTTGSDIEQIVLVALLCTDFILVMKILAYWR
jgi:inner membrane protein